MIDPALALPFSLHASKGVYALLLGSGVSRPAGIPTGWEITLDLIRQLARLRRENSEPDPDAWYRQIIGELPDYDRILDSLARSSTERSQLLRRYFEPTPEDRQRGLKVPTAGHRAIAQLTAGGYIRVIITTNFDRLIEQALEDAGVIPTVIATPDAAEGALPLVHTACCVVKVHGDYLDTRIKNTPAELAHYDERLNGLLDRIFDEFGLIVSGWSAEYDTALRAALERCKNHRFTTYWTSRGQPGEHAKRLIELRRAVQIRIQDAGEFFHDLHDKVTALEAYARPHPLSAKMAVATVKRYIVSEQERIRLRDLAVEETEALYRNLSEERFPVHGGATNEEFARRVQQYEALTEVVRAVLVTGCYWGERPHAEYWARAIERIGNAAVEPHRASPGTILWLNLRKYPALVLLYSGGIAALAAERYDTLVAMLTLPKIRHTRPQAPVVVHVNTDAVCEPHFGWPIGGRNKIAPVSDHLQNVLRESLRELLPEDVRYLECFDRLEYLLALVHADVELGRKQEIRVPLGCFAWRGFDEGGIIREVDAEFKRVGENWKPLKAGLFDGSTVRFEAASTGLKDFLRRARRNWE
jgi:hypothetical protein